MRNLIVFIILGFTASALANLKPLSLQEAKSVLSQKSPVIQSVLATAPHAYDFIKAGKSTVSYPGQTMRQVLIADSKLAFASFQYGGNVNGYKTVYNHLNSYFRYNVHASGEDSFLVKAKNLDGSEADLYEGEAFSGIFAGEINLESKMAGVDNPLRHGKLLGWKLDEIQGVAVDRNADGKITPVELYESMMITVAMIASDTKKGFQVKNPGHSNQLINGAHITENGLDLAQLSQKFLHGAISFSQAAGDYTSVDLPAHKKGLLGDNATPIAKKPYTVLQHHWDEAFGYFGAARNYLDYSDQQIKEGFSLDVYESEDVEDDTTGEILYVSHKNVAGGDDYVSLGSEKNLGMSVNASKRDLGASLKDMDFTKAIFEPLVQGRHLIQEKPADYLRFAQAYAVVAIHEWERLMAANTIHYINKTLKDYKHYGTTDFKFTNLAKHFSEMKGFALAFQFNPNSVMFKSTDGTISVTAFEAFHSLLGDEPISPASTSVKQYRKNLKEARKQLAETYDFAADTVENW